MSAAWSQCGRLVAKSDPIAGSVTLHAIIPSEKMSDTGNYAATASFSEIPFGGVIPALLTLGRPATQRLLDDLWDAGFRPSRATAEPPTNDYREIVFKLLAIMRGRDE